MKFTKYLDQLGTIYSRPKYIPKRVWKKNCLFILLLSLEKEFLKLIFFTWVIREVIFSSIIKFIFLSKLGYFIKLRKNCILKLRYKVIVECFNTIFSKLIKICRIYLVITLTANNFCVEDESLLFKTYCNAN